jgi:hypothetical protein
MQTINFGAEGKEADQKRTPSRVSYCLFSLRANSSMQAVMAI